eukprot:scaffold426328_cov20-Prasinocladus_malaysianus.AAC.1
MSLSPTASEMHVKVMSAGLGCFHLKTFPISGIKLTQDIMLQMLHSMGLNLRYCPPRLKEVLKRCQLAWHGIAKLGVGARNLFVWHR